MELIDINGGRDDRVVYKSNTVPINGSDVNLSSPGSDSACGGIGKAKVLIFRYAPLISLAEGVLLFCLLVYLFASSPNSSPPVDSIKPRLMPEQHQNPQSPSDPNQRRPSNGSPTTTTDSNDAQAINRYESLFRNYTDTDGGAQVRLAPSLASYCTQRRHDIIGAISCRSQNVEKFCEQIEPQMNVPEGKKTEEYRFFVYKFTTSKSGERLKPSLITLEPSIDSVWCLNDDSWNDTCRVKTKLDIYSDQKRQKIVGFGGALTDSSISNILSLTINGTLRLLDDYFGPKGLKYNMIRVTIGGSDFSSRFYTNDDLRTADGKMAPPDAQPDFNLKNFQLSEEDIMYKIPVLKHVLNQYQKNAPGGQIKILGSMWSPPLWMKTNHHPNKGSLKGSITNEKKKVEGEEYFATLAKFKRNFLSAYRDNSINFWGLTIMNEPFFAVQPFLDYNTMIFPQKDYENYISKYLGPILKDDAQFKDLVLLVHDDNRRYLLNFTEPTLQNPNVFKYINGIATHGYVDEEYELMDKLYNKWKPRAKTNFSIISTELCSGHLPFMQRALVGNWHRGVHYALDIIRTLQHSGSGWIDWNMVLDTTGGPGWLGGRLDSPVIVDKSKDMYYKSPMFYFLGQFSRHIPVGSVKLSSKIYNARFDYHFETVTFLHPDGKNITIVVLNNNPYPIELHIRMKTSDSSIEGQYYPLICQADSVTTFVGPKVW